MFSGVPPRSRFNAAAWAASALLHGVAVLWLLHSPPPTFLAPASVVHGENGVVIAHLYWPNQTGEITSDATARPVSSRQMQKLMFQAKPRKKSEHFSQKPVAEINTRPVSVAQPRQPIPAGSPYGSALEGQTYGYEVRPALPVFSPDPAVDSTDLAGLEGDVVVEVTIDERGTIVDKKIMQGLGAAIDSKVLAALANWQFRPATRNGVPIPSKQDVYYHFPPLHHG